MRLLQKQRKPVVQTAPCHPTGNGTIHVPNSEPDTWWSSSLGGKKKEHRGGLGGAGFRADVEGHLDLAADHDPEELLHKVAVQGHLGTGHDRGPVNRGRG